MEPPTTYKIARRQLNTTVVRQAGSVYVLLLQLLIAGSAYDPAVHSIVAVNPGDGAVLPGIAVTVDTSINPNMITGLPYDTQVLVTFNFSSADLVFVDGILRYDLKIENDSGMNAIILINEDVPISTFSVADSILLDDEIGIRDESDTVGDANKVETTNSWYHIRYYDNNQDSETGLTPVCTIGFVGGTPEYTVNVYETESGALIGTDKHQGVSAVVVGSTVKVYYDTAANPVFGRNSEKETYAYVSVMDTLSHSFQVPLKIMAYRRPLLTDFVFAGAFGHTYGGAKSSSQAAEVLSPLVNLNTRFLLGTFQTSCALDTSSSNSGNLQNENTLLDIVDANINNLSDTYAIIITPADGQPNTYSLYYNTGATGSYTYPEFPARHFQPEITIKEYNRVFSSITVDAYIHRELTLEGNVYGRAGLSGAVLTPVADVYETYYYPESDTFTDSKFLVATFKVSGGLLNSAAVHDYLPFTPSPAIGDVTFDVTIAKDSSGGDTSTVSVYAQLGEQSPASSGRGDLYADFTLTITGSFSILNEDPAAKEHIDVPLRVYAYSDPTVNFTYDAAFDQQHKSDSKPAHAVPAGTTFASTPLSVGTFTSTGLTGSTVEFKASYDNYEVSGLTLQYSGGLSYTACDVIEVQIVENEITFESAFTGVVSFPSGTRPSISHYIYEEQAIVEVKDSTGTAVEPNNLSFPTLYYPSRVTSTSVLGSDFTVNGNGILIGSLLVTGGKSTEDSYETNYSNGNYTQGASSVDGTPPDVNFAVDGSTEVQVYFVLDTINNSDTARARPDNGDNYLHNLVTVNVLSMFVNAADTSVPVKVSSTFYVISLADPSFQFEFKDTFTRKYGDIDAQGLSASSDISNVEIGSFTVGELLDLDSVNTVSITPSSSYTVSTLTDVTNGRAVSYTPSPSASPSYDILSFAISAVENGLTFTTDIRYYLFPQLTVTASVDNYYVNVGDINSQQLTVATQYGLGDYTLDLSALNTSVGVTGSAAGFTWDFFSGASMSFGESPTLSITATPLQNTITNTYPIVLTYQ